MLQQPIELLNLLHQWKINTLKHVLLKCISSGDKSRNITYIKPRISINMYAIIYFTIMVSFQNKSYINAELTNSEKAQHLNVLEIILNDI